MKKELEKQNGNKAQGGLYTGVGGFRSAEEVQEEFAGLDKAFDLKQERRIRRLNKELAKANDFVTGVDKDYLLKVLLRDHHDFLSEKVNLVEGEYKLKCKHKDENNNEIAFNIELLEVEDDLVQVDF